MLTEITVVVGSHFNPDDRCIKFIQYYDYVSKFLCPTYHRSKITICPKNLRPNVLLPPKSGQCCKKVEHAWPRSLNISLHQIISDFARRRQSLKSKCSQPITNQGQFVYKLIQNIDRSCLLFSRVVLSRQM